MDAVVDVAQKQPARRLIIAKGQLAGRRAAQAHLVLDLGTAHAVALAHRAVFVDPELGHQEQRQPLGSRRAALGPSQHQVDDVRKKVRLAAGDKALGAFEVPLIARDVLGFGAACADIAARAFLGQHHRAAPLLLQHVRQKAALLLSRAEAVDDARHKDQRQVKARRRVAAREQLVVGPDQRRRRRHAAQVLGHLQHVPVVVQKHLHRRLQLLGQRHRAIGLQLHPAPVRIGKARRQLGNGQLLHLRDGVARRVFVQRLKRPLSQHARADLVKLKQVKHQVAEVAFVMVRASR